MTARRKTDEPAVELEVGPNVEPQADEQADTAPEDDVAPIVDGAPVSAAARHNARYGDLDTGDDTDAP